MAGEPRYYLDSNVVIAIVEAPEGLSAVQSMFIEGIDRRRISAVTSELTLAECLVKPMADQNARTVAAYLTFLDDRSEFPVLPVSRGILLEAAQLRATIGIKLPDAIHVATASLTMCSVFLTNDRRVKSAGNIKIQLWDKLVAI